MQALCGASTGQPARVACRYGLARCIDEPHGYRCPRPDQRFGEQTREREQRALGSVGGARARHEMESAFAVTQHAPEKRTGDRNPLLERVDARLVVVAAQDGHANRAAGAFDARARRLTRPRSAARDSPSSCARVTHASPRALPCAGHEAPRSMTTRANVSTPCRSAISPCPDWRWAWARAADRKRSCLCDTFDLPVSVEHKACRSSRIRGMENGRRRGSRCLRRVPSSVLARRIAEPRTAGPSSSKELRPCA